jgi:hypothetical protein
MSRIGCHKCPHKVPERMEEFAGLAWEKLPCATCPAGNPEMQVERRNGEVSYHPGMDEPGPQTWRPQTFGPREHTGEASEFFGRYLAMTDGRRARARRMANRGAKSRLARWVFVVPWDEDRTIAHAFQTGWDGATAGWSDQVCAEAFRKRLAKVCRRWPELKPWLLPLGGRA